MRKHGKALITGASTGIGRATAQRLVNAGYHVVGTSRHPEAIAKGNLIEGVEYVSLELSDDSSIDELKSHLADIDILINNAGSSQIGPTETVPFDRIEYLFHVNFYGPLKIIQAALPHMRKRGSGRIVNVTSLAGHWALPFSSIYAASKYALEGVTCGLRTEVKPWGIRMVNVAPSAVHTQIEQEVQYTAESPYFAFSDTMKRRRDRFIDEGPGPEVVAKVIEKAALTRHPRTWYAAGRHSGLMSLLLRALPGPAIEYLISSIYGIRQLPAPEEV